MKKSTKRKNYVSTKIGRELIKMALMRAPKIGLESDSTIMVLFGAALMAKVGVEGYQLIPNITPCAKTLCEFLFEGTVYSIILERDLMLSAPLAILCDKRDGRKITEGDKFVKVTATFSREEGGVRGVDITYICIFSTSNNPDSAAKNITHCLELYDTLTYIIVFDNQGTYASGEGTREDLGKKLGKEIGERNWGKKIE